VLAGAGKFAVRFRLRLSIKAIFAKNPIAYMQSLPKFASGYQSGLSDSDSIH
jgi:hypothetical protein